MSFARPLDWRLARWAATLPTVFLLLGLAVRLRYFLQNPSYWYDEAYLLLNVFTRSYADLLGRSELDQVAPPLFLWAERALYDLFGPAEWAMRWPALLAGLAALPAMLPLARRIVGDRLAWLPVAFVALSRHALTHSVEAKPYTLDFLLLVLIGLAVVSTVGAEERRPRWAWPALLALALVGPWLSFPAVFGLAAASVALLLQALRSGRRTDWLGWAVLTLVTLVSGGAVWYLHARHLHTPTLALYWSPDRVGGFPDLTRPLAVLGWPLHVAVSLGNYGTREMGIPLAILGLVGTVTLARRNLAVAVGVIGPAVLAVAASYLGKYPLAGRTGFFLLPALWLTATLGMKVLLDHVSARAWVIPLVLLAPDAVVLVRHLAVPPQHAPARELFARVHAERQAGDVVWVSHPEVYRIYHPDAGEVVGYLTPPDELARRVKGRRVWLVAHAGPLQPWTDQVLAQLRELGHTQIEEVTAFRIELQVWEPAGLTAPESRSR